VKSATLVLLLIVFCAPASAKEKTPPKESVRIPLATWSNGFVHLSDAVVVGKVTEVNQTVSPVDPKSKIYEYTLSVDGVAGDCPELNGVKEIRSESNHPVKVGKWVLMLVHYYEEKPDLATGSRPLEKIKNRDDPLAKFFIAKGLDFQNYTEKDMLLLKKRMPATYKNLHARREILEELNAMTAEEKRDYESPKGRRRRENLNPSRPEPPTKK